MQSTSFSDTERVNGKIMKTEYMLTMDGVEWRWNKETNETKEPSITNN